MAQFKRVLILGNSLVKHEPLAAVGWPNNWGMAASAKEKDFVHILKRWVQEQDPEGQVFFFNIAAFERYFPEREYQDAQLVIDLADQWEPDLIIMRIGENADDEHSVENRFDEYYEGLLAQLKAAGNSKVICATAFWEKKYINNLIMDVAKRNGYTLVDITPLGADPTNQALGLHEHPGVCAHPGDKGMQEIARSLWAAMQEM